MMTDEFGWAPLISFMTAALGAAAGYGGAIVTGKRNAADVRTLTVKIETDKRESETGMAGLREEINAHRLHVSESYVRKGDLDAMETRLGKRLDDMRTDFYSKVDEIKIDLGKKGIEHAIKNAIAAVLSPEQIQAARERRA